jgi:lysozyme family protein
MSKFGALRGDPSQISRRDVIRWASSASVAALASGPASAQSLSDILEKLPDLKGIVPAKPLNLARTIATIMRLERDANAKQLPNSLLAFREGQPIMATPTTLYKASVPRLVALIDRSEGSDQAMADEAAEVLAEVNASEREVPAALQTEAPAPIAPPVVVPAPAPLVLSSKRDFPSLKAEYAQLFSTLEVRAENQELANWYRTMMAKSKPRYQEVGKDLGVPWFFIAATHGLEASFNFRAHLHNGDFPLTARTRQVPAGRPLVWLPPADWESSAKDAIKLLGFANQSDWTLERTLYRLEAYNGFGYRRRGVPTPYLWSFSNHYDRGKFVADGSFNPKARSQQCGAAVMIKLLVDAGEIQGFA